MWHEILFRVLSIVNYAVLIVIAIPLLLQIFYVLFSFVKKKTYPVSEQKGRVAYLIPAHNEEDVIFTTVKALLEEQDYPRDKFDVFVVAHNCTDRTAELAMQAGAKVLILNDPDPAHRMALYPMKYGVDHILGIRGEGTYDFILRLDADNHVNREFTSLMNDAFQSGVEFGRSYEGALNGAQNFYTKACALFYAFGCMLTDALAPLGLPPAWSAFLAGLLEMTAGCSRLLPSPTPAALAAAAFLVTFGGACVLMQQWCFLSKTGIPLAKFLGMKAVQACFAALAAFALGTVFLQ